MNSEKKNRERIDYIGEQKPVNEKRCSAWVGKILIIKK
jgi:hypothetical protein